MLQVMQSIIRLKRKHLLLNLKGRTSDDQKAESDFQAGNAISLIFTATHDHIHIYVYQVLLT